MECTLIVNNLSKVSENEEGGTVIWGGGANGDRMLAGRKMMEWGGARGGE